MVEDVTRETSARLIGIAPKDADAVRHAGRQIVDFSEPMQAQLMGLRTFLYENVYRHYKVNRARSHAKRIIGSLFDVFLSEPETLPPQWRRDDSEGAAARAVCDYIAGMTDRYAILEFGKLFGAGPTLA
jgi:dGTPase